VTPVDRRSKRLLPRQRGAPSSGQECEPVGQPIEDLFGREDSGPNGGQLDRERQTVEAAAQLDDGCLVRAGQLEGSRCGGSALGEQCHGLVLPKLGEWLIAVGRRKPERRHRDDMLPGHLEWLSGRGQHSHVGCRAKDVGHQARRGLEEMLTVVENQEQLTFA
jgi:hypothetical protein